MNRLCKCLILSVLLIFLSSCGKSKLSRKEMVDVLYDIHFAEATIQVAANNSPRIEKQEYYHVIFKKYGITKEYFDKSVAWYANNPKEYKLVYEDLISRAEQFKTRVDALEFHPEMRPTHIDTIGFLDLWYWQKEILLCDSVNYSLSPDSLRFTLNDSVCFQLSDTLLWRFRLTAKSAIIGDSSNVMMMLNYNDYIDTVSYYFPLDSVKRAVTFTKVLSDTLRLKAVELCFLDNLDSVSYVEVDSIVLNRVYNSDIYPLSDSIRQNLEKKRDSILNSNIEIEERVINSKLMVAPIKNR